MAEGFVQEAANWLRTNQDTPQFRLRALLMSEIQSYIIEQFLKDTEDGMTHGRQDGGWANSTAHGLIGRGYTINQEQVLSERARALAILGQRWGGMEAAAQTIARETDEVIKQILVIANEMDAKLGSRERLTQLREVLGGFKTKAELSQIKGSDKLALSFDRLKSEQLGMAESAFDEFLTVILGYAQELIEQQDLSIEYEQGRIAAEAERDALRNQKEELASQVTGLRKDKEASDVHAAQLSGELEKVRTTAEADKKRQAKRIEELKREKDELNDRIEELKAQPAPAQGVVFSEMREKLATRQSDVSNQIAQLENDLANFDVQLASAHENIQVADRSVMSLVAQLETIRAAIRTANDDETMVAKAGELAEKGTSHKQALSQLEGAQTKKGAIEQKQSELAHELTDQITNRDILGKVGRELGRFEAILGDERVLTDPSAWYAEHFASVSSLSSMLDVLDAPPPPPSDPDAGAPPPEPTPVEKLEALRPVLERIIMKGLYDWGQLSKTLDKLEGDEAYQKNHQREIEDLFTSIGLNAYTVLTFAPVDGVITLDTITKNLRARLPASKFDNKQVGTIASAIYNGLTRCGLIGRDNRWQWSHLTTALAKDWIETQRLWWQLIQYIPTAVKPVT